MPTKLSHLKERELKALAAHLKIGTSLSKPDLEVYLSGRFSDRTLADALRVLRSQGLIVPSMDEQNAKALGESRECLRLCAVSGIAKPDGSPLTGNCMLPKFHDGPCQANDAAVKFALSKAIAGQKFMQDEANKQALGHMPPGTHKTSSVYAPGCGMKYWLEGQNPASVGPAGTCETHKDGMHVDPEHGLTWPIESIDSPLTGESSSKNGKVEPESMVSAVSGLLANIEATDPDTKAKFVTEPFLNKALVGQLEILKSKTLELFDEEFSDRAVILGAHIDEQAKLLSKQIDERIAGIKIEAGSPAVQSFNIVLPEKSEQGKSLSKRPHVAFMKILCLVRAGLIPLMVGPAGSGKTTIAEMIAEALELPYYGQSCTFGMSKSEIIGGPQPLGEGGAMRYVSSPIMQGWAGERNTLDNGILTVVKDDSMAGVCHLDEVDGADANTTMVTNSMLANNKIMIGGRAVSHLDIMVHKHPRSIVTMAGNTFGTGMDMVYQGRGALDGAFLDRGYTVMVNYDPFIEAAIGNMPDPDIPLWQHARPPSIAEWQDLYKWCMKVRERVEKDGIKKVWGTRAITKARAARFGGIPTLEVKRDLLLGWPADLARKMMDL